MDASEKHKEYDGRERVRRRIAWKLATLAVVATSAGMLAAFLFLRVPDQGRAPLAIPYKREAGKLIRHSEPQNVEDIVFTDADGTVRRLSEWRGRVVLLNLWATWCAPCKTEMPSLDRLQAKLGGDGFTVLALSTDRSGPKEPAAFLARQGIGHLKLYNDDTGGAAVRMRAAGLPMTAVLNENGQEVARFLGPAEWDSPEMISEIENLRARERPAQ
jgi:thiol-disulfide isomerase/thioredoxin